MYGVELVKEGPMSCFQGRFWRMCKALLLRHCYYHTNTAI